MSRSQRRVWIMYGRRLAGVCILLVAGSLLLACNGRISQFAGQEPMEVSLSADGRTESLSTHASNVRELLQEAGISLNDSDEVTPPLHTPLSDGLAVIVVRLTESIEFVEEIIPFDRKIVRSEGMSASDPPRIIQAGLPGLQELTLRIVYRDGLESERRATQVTILEQPQDEIVMVGFGATPGNLSFAGVLAYIAGGRAHILRGTTAFPEQMNTGEGLDGRVFSLSPTGSHLLYTLTTTDTESFNSLWVISTQRGAEPRSLEVSNVLWAGWNPAAAEPLQIAYTTGRPTEQPPGWEANNDLWLADILASEAAALNPRQIVEAYTATYGWWGGNYAWAPTGRYIAYSYADEVGLIDVEAGNAGERRLQLRQFTEYNTRGDWVWVPSLTWSPDGRYLTFTQYGNEDRDTPHFDTWTIDVTSGVAGRFVEQAGMWAHPHWSPSYPDPFHTGQESSQIAFLRATNPLDSQRSSYTLWLMDRDGSNARQIYPPAGENSHFPGEQQFMAWSATGRDVAFIFNNTLYILNLDSGEAHRISQDDTIVRNPTWAPYGQAIPSEVPATEVVPVITPEREGPPLRLLPDEE